MSWQLLPCLLQILSGKNFFLKSLPTSLPTWNSQPSFSLRYKIYDHLTEAGLWLDSINVIKDVANNPFHIFIRRDYLHEQAM